MSLVELDDITDYYSNDKYSEAVDLRICMMYANETLNYDTDDILIFSRSSEKELDEVLGTNSDENEDNNKGGGFTESKYVTTYNHTDQEQFSLNLHGALRGASDETEVGFILSTDKDFTKTQTLSMKSKNGLFGMSIYGMMDQTTYYYRSYAKINGKTEMGEVKKFTTPELTYSINGVTYKFIKINGPYGQTSMMQTELPLAHTTTIALGDISVSLTNWDRIDERFTKGMMRELISRLWGSWIPLRYPTSEEWLIAATGGDENNSFIYSGSDDINEVAWYANNSTRANFVAQKKPNKLGFYDMSGNFSELVCDEIDLYIRENNYETAKFIDAMWAYTYGYGGNWKSPASECTIYSRFKVDTSGYMFDNEILAMRLCFTREPLINLRGKAID